MLSCCVAGAGRGKAEPGQVTTRVGDRGGVSVVTEAECLRAEDTSSSPSMLAGWQSEINTALETLHTLASQCHFHLQFARSSCQTFFRFLLFLDCSVQNHWCVVSRLLNVHCSGINDGRGALTSNTIIQYAIYCKMLGALTSVLQ